MRLPWPIRRFLASGGKKPRFLTDPLRIIVDSREDGASQPYERTWELTRDTGKMIS